MIAYRFFMSINGDSEIPVNPLYKDLTKDYAKEANQMFFRAKLSGKLTFVGPDYEQIRNASFAATFAIRIQYYDGHAWGDYWNGVFYKTDGEFDEDSKTFIVNPTVNDQYTKILAGWENTYDLIQLAPPMQRLSYWKRPIFQFYIQGANAIGCYQMGMYWEQECEIVTSSSQLINTYKFGALKSLLKVKVTGASVDAINAIYYGSPSSESFTFRGLTPQHDTTGYEFVCIYQQGGQGNEYHFVITDGTNNLYASDAYSSMPDNVTLNPVSGSGMTGTVSAYITHYNLYSRLICDVSVPGETGSLPNPDITPSSNYHYVQPLSSRFASFIAFDYWFTDDNEPSIYGQFYDGDDYVGYYYRNRSIEGYDGIPMMRSTWDEISVWFLNGMWALVPLGNIFRCKEVLLNDAYPLIGVIQTVIKQIDPSLTFEAGDAYSQFLNNLGQTLYITPKTNILVSEYTQPATQAPITLKVLMDALRDMFRAYCFIEDGKFKIEQIRYFMNGRSYDNPMTVGRDLTTEMLTRNGKNWAFAQNKWKYDKPGMPERYEFGWMDESTQIFRGEPLVIISPFVNKGQKEEINVQRISTDIDYMLSNPSNFSEEGFAMLSCDNTFKVINWQKSSNFYIQNGMLSFDYLERNYYIYDMPSWNCTIGDNGPSLGVQGIKKTRNQQVTFPALDDPDLFKLIKTEIGNGQIEKLSINLASRNAKVTLCYAYGSTV